MTKKITVDFNQEVVNNTDSDDQKSLPPKQNSIVSRVKQHSVTSEGSLRSQGILTAALYS